MLYIGLNADERDKRTGNHGLLPFVSYEYPLADNGLNRAACILINKKAGLEVKLPPYMQRGGCKGCFYKKKSEYEAMIRLAPEQFQEIIELERSIQDKRGSFYHISDKLGMSMQEFKTAVESKPFLFNNEQVYVNADLQTSCGVFCNR